MLHPAIVATQTMPEAQAGDGEAERARTVEEGRTGRRSVRFVKQLGADAMKNSITDVAAQMAYYAVLAMFPMLVFIITLALLVIDPATIHQGLDMATRTMPGAVHDLVRRQANSLIATADAGFAIGAAALALWGASRGAAALGDALNVIFHKKETRGWLKRQAIAIGVTFGVAVLIIVALGLLVLGPVVGHYVADRFGLGGAFDVAWGIGRWLGAGVLVMLVWAIMYKVLPNTDAPFRIFTVGAFVGVLLWLGISLLFGLYLRYFNSYDATYGALGGAIIFLVWLWLSNLALLFGAEVNDVLADFRKHKSAGAAQLADEPHAQPATN